MDAAHAGTGRIGGTNGAGWQLDNLRNACWPVGKVSCKPAKISEEGVDVGGEAKASARGIRLSESKLESAEEPLASRDSKDHGAKLAKSLMPLFDGHSLLGGGYGVKDGMKAFKAMGW
jgi:hypothetical protein